MQYREKAVEGPNNRKRSIYLAKHTKSVGKVDRERSDQLSLVYKGLVHKTFTGQGTNNEFAKRP
jgi:hypothetical protein